MPLMTWTLSSYGEKLSAPSGINELMRDLGLAMSGRADMLMLGGGNPAHIPAMEAMWRLRWQAIADEPGRLERVLGNYDEPKGSPDFIAALADSLRARYGWDIGPENVAVVNGSQNAFFYLFNMLGNRRENGHKRILLPLAPEYIGYADQCLPPGSFHSIAPTVVLHGDRRFKYVLDRDRVTVGPDTAAICVSRPTNPTGNVLTDDEIDWLEALAGRHHIPLIIDNAYGAPFPDILFTDIKPVWTDNTILVMSLSKLGLPGVRTGIIVAREEIIEAVAATHAVAGLANGNIGQAIVTPLLRDGRLYDLCRDEVRPFYQQKSRQAIQWLEQAMAPGIPMRIHEAEGALFLWLWFEGLPITAEALYHRLKRKGVLVVPGHYFFFGLDEGHPHQHSCLRLSYAQAPEVVRRGVEILADEVAKVYRGG